MPGPGRQWLAAIMAAGAIASPLGACAALGQAGGASGSSDRCSSGWSPLLAGRPKGIGQRAGYAVWRDAHAWHVRSTAPKRSAAFTGRIRSAHAVRWVRVVGGEAGDRVQRAGSRTLTFELHGRARDVDGVDFVVSCATVAFRLAAHGIALPPRRIRLGAAGEAPTAAFVAAPQESSGVRGKVVYRPTCAVEDSGTDCPERTVQTTVDVETGGGSKDNPQPRRPVTSVNTDPSGRYEVSLPPGDYVLTPRRPPGDTTSTPKPANVSVVQGVVSEVDLTLDTGVRGPEG